MLCNYRRSVCVSLPYLAHTVFFLFLIASCDRGSCSQNFKAYDKAYDCACRANRQRRLGATVLIYHRRFLVPRLTMYLSIQGPYALVWSCFPYFIRSSAFPRGRIYSSYGLLLLPPPPPPLPPHTPACSIQHCTLSDSRTVPIRTATHARSGFFVSRGRVIVRVCVFFIKSVCAGRGGTHLLFRFTWLRIHHEVAYGVEITLKSLHVHTYTSCRRFPLPPPTSRCSDLPIQYSRCPGVWKT